MDLRLALLKKIPPGVNPSNDGPSASGPVVHLE